MAEFGGVGIFGPLLSDGGRREHRKDYIEVRTVRWCLGVVLVLSILSVVLFLIPHKVKDPSDHSIQLDSIHLAATVLLIIALIFLLYVLYETKCCHIVQNKTHRPDSPTEELDLYFPDNEGTRMTIGQYILHVLCLRTTHHQQRPIFYFNVPETRDYSTESALDTVEVKDE